jgi:hypothetical protein
VLEPLLLNRSEIHPGRWDSVISGSLYRGFYSCSWYLDIVCESWYAFVWPSSVDYQIIMPLPVKRRLGFAVVYQPQFCQFLGLFSKSPVTSEVLESFLRTCVSHFPYISSYSFHPDLYCIIQPLRSHFKNIIFAENRTCWQRMDAEGRYSSDRMRNLKKGKEQNWSIENMENTDTIIRLFDIHHAAEVGGVCEKSYQILDKLVNAFREHGNVTLQYASLNGKLHAGILLFSYGGYVVYIFNAADESGRRGNARTVMLDRYFEENKGTDLLFDFESAQQPYIHSFYSSFGGVDAPFFSISKTNLLFPLNHLQRLRRSLIKTKRALLSNLYRI